MVGSSECDNGPSGSTKGEEVLDQLRDYKLLCSMKLVLLALG
jgi:hypothetical protein